MKAQLDKEYRSQLYKIFKERGYLLGAEIGVAKGKNAVNILETIPNSCLYLIDPWARKDRSERYNRIYKRQAFKNLKDYEDRIAIIEKSSEDASKYFLDGSLDFVYIDGNHSYDSVLLDIILWGKKIKVGGILSGHDYVRTDKQGVKKAVDSYVKYHKIDLKVWKHNWYWEITEGYDN